MSALLKTRFTPAEYLKFERASEEKHEYLNGKISVMPPSNLTHIKIVSNLGGLLWHYLKGKPYEGFISRMRLFIEQTGLYTYPDLGVISNNPKFEDAELDSLLNPILLIEILSDSTEGYDRGRKFQHYRSIEILQEYILVSQNEARIEKYVKTGDGFWLLSEAVGTDSEIEFTSIECRIALAEVYDKIDFSAE